VHGESTRVEDVATRELGGVEGFVLVPDGAEAVDVDVGDVEVEDAAGLAGAAGADEDAEFVEGLAAPEDGGHAERREVLNMVRRRVLFLRLKFLA
jgi:hypothetical protein